MLRGEFQAGPDGHGGFAVSAVAARARLPGQTCRDAEPA